MKVVIFFWKIVDRWTPSWISLNNELTRGMRSSFLLAVASMAYKLSAFNATLEQCVNLHTCYCWHKRPFKYGSLSHILWIPSSSVGVLRESLCSRHDLLLLQRKITSISYDNDLCALTASAFRALMGWDGKKVKWIMYSNYLLSSCWLVDTFWSGKIGIDFVAWRPPRNCHFPYKRNPNSCNMHSGMFDICFANRLVLENGLVFKNNYIAASRRILRLKNPLQPSHDATP